MFFSGVLAILSCLFGLKPSFEIAPAESSGPGPESKSSQAPQNISPLTLFMQNGCLISLAGHPQGKATVSTSASGKNKVWVWFKEFNHDSSNVNLS